MVVVPALLLLASTVHSDPTSSIPPHRAHLLPWVHGYVAKQSVAAGETVQLMFSSSLPYNLSIHRIGPNLDSMDDDVLVHSFGVQEPRVQPIHFGSYVHAAPLQSPLRMLSIRLWIRPYKTTAPARQRHWSGLVTSGNLLGACAFGLLLSPDKKVGFYLRPGSEHMWSADHLHSDTRSLEPGEWHHVAAVWDGTVKSVYVNGTRLGAVPLSGELDASAFPLRIGAMGSQERTGLGEADHFLDADVAHVLIVERGFDEAELRREVDDWMLEHLPPPSAAHDYPVSADPHVLRQFDFREQRGASL